MQMKKPPFASTCDECEAFRLRADLLREMFGMWDPIDPVSHCILDLVEAQRELSDAIDDYRPDAGCASASPQNEDPPCVRPLVRPAGWSNQRIRTAIAKRHAAGERLMEVLEDRDLWPDPRLGHWPTTPKSE
jgi:hypothetical protein